MAEGAENEDRTEEPTQRKLDEAIEKGDVARSQEIGTFFVLCGFTLALLIGAGSAARDAALSLRSFLMNAHQVSDDAGALFHVTSKAVMTGFGALAVPLGLILLAALAGALIQHKPLWTTEPLMPKFDRISPMAGAKRIFGKDAWVNFAKGLAKILLVGIGVWLGLWGERDRLQGFAQMDVHALLPAVLVLTIKLMAGVLAIFAIIAIGDFGYQRFSWYRRQRMTKQELKDEYKNTEGNPEVKAKLRQLRVARPLAHDGAGAEGDGDHHQPDPLCRRPAIRAGPGRAALPRQGCRCDRAQDPRGRRRAQHPDRREPAPRPRALCHRRDRRRNSCRTLSGGGRSHRIRLAPEAPPRLTRWLGRRPCDRTGRRPTADGRLKETDPLQ